MLSRRSSLLRLRTRLLLSRSNGWVVHVSSIWCYSFRSSILLRKLPHRCLCTQWLLLNNSLLKHTFRCCIVFDEALPLLLRLDLWSNSGRLLDGRTWNVRFMVTPRLQDWFRDNSWFEVTQHRNRTWGVLSQSRIWTRVVFSRHNRLTRLNHPWCLMRVSSTLA